MLVNNQDLCYIQTYSTILFRIMTNSKLDKKLNKQQQEMAKKMIKAGVHFGHGKSTKDPRMDQYISIFKSGVYIIDIFSIITKLEQALDFIEDTVSKGGTILFVGTQPQIKEDLEKTAIKCDMPYVIERWIGGTITNFETIHKGVEHLLDLEKKKESGELKKYTKKEQLIFDEEIKGLNQDFKGVKKMDKLPDAILVMSIKENQSSIKEAAKKGIPIIGLTDTNANPNLVDYPIPANDDGVASLKFMLKKFEQTIIKNKTNKTK